MVLGAVTSPGGHSNDDVWKAEMDGIPMEMPSATGTPTQGWWLGSPVPPGCWSTLSCCKQMGRKQILQVGEGFFPLVLSFFFFEAQICQFGGEAAAAHPTLGEKVGCVLCPRPPRSHWGRVR